MRPLKQFPPFQKITGHQDLPTGECSLEFAAQGTVSRETLLTVFNSHAYLHLVHEGIGMSNAALHLPKMELLWWIRRYLESVRRFNYTTPKSYLELISLYKGLLEKKRAELRANKERLENGVDKISQASAQVSPTELLGKSHGKLLHSNRIASAMPTFVLSTASWGMRSCLQPCS